MPEARNGINPLKSSLVSQFLHRITVEMHIYPASATPTQLKPYHARSRKIFFQVSWLLRFRKTPRPERHGHIERANSTLGNKSFLTRGEQRPVVHRQTDLFPGSPRVLFVKTVKGTLFSSTNQNYYRSLQPKFPVKNQIYGQPVVVFPGNLEIPGIFRSIGHTSSPDTQPQFLTEF